MSDFLYILPFSSDAEAIYQRKSLKRKRSTSRSRTSRSLGSTDDATSSANQSIRDKIAIGRDRAKSKVSLQ